MHRITPKVARRGSATPSWDDRRVRAANPEPFRNPPGCERRLAAVEGQGTLCVLRGSNESERPGSNRRRPAWEGDSGRSRNLSQTSGSEVCRRLSVSATDTESD